MKEEILYVNLPEGAKLQRVIVTESGDLKIVYSHEWVCEDTQKVKIPKPAPLVGGSSVYQANGVPYWYCRIKDNRDEFMCLYMEDLTEDDLLYDSTGKERSFYTTEEKQFKENCLEALANKPIDGFRWLPVYEVSSKNPSHLSNLSKLKFVKGKEPAVGEGVCSNWEEAFKSYSPKNGSGMCSKTTYFLLLLRWLKDGIASLEQLADHSEEIGHYYDSFDARMTRFEKSGDRRFGGLCGFVGNTLKIVKDSKSPSGYSIVGGSFLRYGRENPAAKLDSFSNSGQIAYQPYGVGVTIGLIELKGRRN